MRSKKCTNEQEIHRTKQHNTNVTYMFQLPLYQQKSPLNFEGKETRSEEQKENLSQRWQQENSKPFSTPNASAEQRQVMTIKKGGKQKFHISTYHLYSFFWLNSLTSFEISWVTTNMSINENVTKEKKHCYITVFKRQLSTSNLFILQKERTVNACFDFSEESRWYVHTVHCILNYWAT